jgi:lipopolysaccharide/colanic/teichoic acid biosynthesis glycosyltransferase
MSIVGNKPLPLYEASSFTTNEAASRFEAPAGMTGLWQIQNKSGDTGCTLTQDLAYAKKGSFWLDIRIMMKAGMQYTGMRRRRRAR